MRFRVEAWTFRSEEEGGEEELVESKVFEFSENAAWWAWQKMEEGFQTRMYRE